MPCRRDDSPLTDIGHGTASRRLRSPRLSRHARSVTVAPTAASRNLSNRLPAVPTMTRAHRAWNPQIPRVDAVAFWLCNYVCGSLSVLMKLQRRRAMQQAVFDRVAAVNQLSHMRGWATAQLGQQRVLCSAVPSPSSSITSGPAGGRSSCIVHHSTPVLQMRPCRLAGPAAQPVPAAAFASD